MAQAVLSPERKGMVGPETSRKWGCLRESMVCHVTKILNMGLRAQESSKDLFLFSANLGPIRSPPTYTWYPTSSGHGTRLWSRNLCLKLQSLPGSQCNYPGLGYLFTPSHQRPQLIPTQAESWSQPAHADQGSLRTMKSNQGCC